MFYKRISDLHPLGVANNGDWSDITPLPVPSAGLIHDIQSADHSDSFQSRGVPTALTCRTELDPLDTAFDNYYWYKPGTTTYNYSTARVSEDELDVDSDKLKSEYYAKSLWFEVGISKTAGTSEKPSRPTSSRPYIHKYQSKRVNAYLLFTNIDEISAKEISAQLISANSVICKEVSSTVITTNVIKTDIISADFADIDSLSARTITADAISSYMGIINNIRGDNLYYSNARFDNITVTGEANLTAEAAYWADVAEIYTADKGYLYGTLVKFGGEKEITIADDKANAVVSEKPAITLNSGNKEENALPIVLTGRSKVRVIHPVKKFDKIYLSETPGVGSISSYKISSAITPIGIALEAKPYEEEGVIECILQVNFE